MKSVVVKILIGVVLITKTYVGEELKDTNVEIVPAINQVDKDAFNPFCVDLESERKEKDFKLEKANPFSTLEKFKGEK